MYPFLVEHGVSPATLVFPYRDHRTALSTVSSSSHPPVAPASRPDCAQIFAIARLLRILDAPCHFTDLSSLCKCSGCIRLLVSLLVVIQNPCTLIPSFVTSTILPQKSLRRVRTKSPLDILSSITPSCCARRMLIANACSFS